QLAAVDLRAVGNDPSYGSQPGADARAGTVDEGGKIVVEHRRIELPRLAIGVDIGAREIGLEERRTARGGRGEKLVDERILGPPQGQPVEPRRPDEARRIPVAAVW